MGSRNQSEFHGRATTDRSRLQLGTTATRRPPEPLVCFSSRLGGGACRRATRDGHGRRCRSLPWNNGEGVERRTHRHSRAMLELLVIKQCKFPPVNGGARDSVPSVSLSRELKETAFRIVLLGLREGRGDTCKSLSSAWSRRPFGWAAIAVMSSILYCSARRPGPRPGTAVSTQHVYLTICLFSIQNFIHSSEDDCKSSIQYKNACLLRKNTCENKNSKRCFGLTNVKVFVT